MQSKMLAFDLIAVTGIYPLPQQSKLWSGFRRRRFPYWTAHYMSDLDKNDNLQYAGLAVAPSLKLEMLRATSASGCGFNP
ncbi:hypothetical protein CTN06_10385 [Pectobacterium zantedeschiae]|uniref:Uncharacterized protein n=1 Tax=Pectobacterium zantedeschiae TaxID=2034769 RepID=A0A9X8JGK6_9GAMM|nr:hypothetical protein CLR69_15060 [Pectobacterium zantedeschiae]RYC46721.1 hypothetical protein CTN06_10385 [Pectobacterium zantedeschiae]